MGLLKAHAQKNPPQGRVRIINSIKTFLERVF